MSDLRDRMTETAERFAPTHDWLEGSLRRARRRRRSRRFVSAVAVLLIFALAFLGLSRVFAFHSSQAPAGAPACPRTWRQTPVAPAAGGLTAVSAVSATDAWAVGPNDDQSPGSATTIERWNGTGWTRVPSPNAAVGAGAVNELNGVAAISADDAWAVGDYGTRQPGTSLYPLRPLVEHWDGNRWSIVRVPDAYPLETMTSVAATGPDDVWAVGVGQPGQGDFVAIAEHWDGNAWSVADTPSLHDAGGGSALHAVTALSPADAWAVGGSGRTALAEHWDGSHWTRVDLPGQDMTLAAVDASSPDNVWAVGWGTNTSPGHLPPPVVERFDGTAWRMVDLTAPASEYLLPSAVAVVSPRDVWIAGWMNTSTLSTKYGTDRALVAHWDGERARLVDIGIHGRPLNVAGAATSEGRVWLVGRAGGSFSGGQNDYMVGDRPFAWVGTCVAG